MDIRTPLPPLGAFRNAHAGARCFLVGNAPSLASLDLGKLRGELFFTVNRGYLAARLGLPTAPYHVVADPLTYGPYAREIREADLGTRFYRADVMSLVEYAEAPDREAAIEVPFHRSPTMDEGHFAEDVTEGVYRGFTVLLDAAQLAFSMGCREVYIIGCDLDYTQEATHFYPGGVVERARRTVMPVPQVLKAMAVAAGVFERHGRLLANAGTGGRLESIARVPFESLF